RSNHSQGRRNGGNPQPSHQPVSQRMNLLTHGAAVADNAARPIEHTLAFGREALESGAAIDQEHAEGFFELLETGRKRWLGDPATIRRTPKMLFSGQGE